MYLDELPEKKYLKAEFNFIDEIPLVTFSLYNPEGIEDSLYKTIHSHYERLNLLKRMREKSNENITDIIESIRTNYILNYDIEFLKKIIVDQETKIIVAYGFNYWKSVSTLSLIEYDEFWKKIL